MGISIPVWCIIDVAAILNKFPQGGTEDNPTYLGNYQDSDAFVSMVAQLPFVDEGDGSSELGLKAPQGANIQFMANTFAQPSNYRVTLFAAKPNRDDVCSPFVMETIAGGISALSANVRTDVQVGDYTGYNIVFGITFPVNFYTAFYYWDPKVTVSA
jgi:Inclusion body protein